VLTSKSGKPRLTPRRTQEDDAAVDAATATRLLRSARDYYQLSLEVSLALDRASTHTFIGPRHYQYLRACFPVDLFVGAGPGTNQERPTMICNAYNNLGTVVDLLKDPQTALKYHRQALEIAQETSGCPAPTTVADSPRLGLTVVMFPPCIRGGMFRR